MANDVAVQQPKVLAAIDEEKAWGAGLNFDPADLKLSEISVMQGTSDLVKAGEASVGEWRDNDAGEILGTKKAGPEVMVISQRKILFTDINKKAQRPEVYSETRHAGLKMVEETPQGRITRKIAFEFTVLVADKRIAERMPYVLLFQSTQFVVGQRLSTMFRNMARQGLPSAAKVLRLKTYEDSNDKGSWLSKDYEIARDATADELVIAREWWQAIKAGEHQVAYATNEEAAAAPSAARSGKAFEDVPPPTDADRLQF